MKNKLFHLLILLKFTSCGPADVWWNGDIDLGDDYYYMVEPAFNSIQSLDSRDTNRSNGYILRDIEYIGFNNDFILAINNVNTNPDYWIIDKHQKENLPLSILKYKGKRPEIIRPVDSLSFVKFKSQHRIELKSKVYYRNKRGYE